jgi:hypothetical protein
MILINISLTLLVLLTPPAVVAGAKHQTFQLRLSTDAMVSDVKQKHAFNSSWRIYDRQGRQVAELGGEDDDHFRHALNLVFESPSSVSDQTLGWELSRLEEQDGNPLKKMPEADFTIIKYWIKDCEPCLARGQRSVKVLDDVLKSYQKRAVNILNVDIDIQQRVEEMKKKGYIKR